MPEKIKIAEIDAADRLRPVEPSIVDAYAAIAETRVADGQSPLIQPIIVRPAPGGGYRLIAGANRLAALIELGRETLEIGVDAVVRDEDDRSARKSEIYENLAQPGMTQLDRAIFLAEAKRLSDEERGETRGRMRKDQQFKEIKKCQTFGNISSERFTKVASARLGLSEASIKEAVALAAALKTTPDVIDALRGTMQADNQQELKALAELDPDSRRKAVTAIRGGEAKTVRDARIAIGLDKKPTDDPQARLLGAALDAWKKMTKRTRATFMADAGLVYADKDEARA